MSPHRSRTHWQDEDPPKPTNVPLHEHALRPGVRVILAGMAVLQLLCLLGLGMVAVYAWQDHEYVQGRGQMRDAENAELNKRIDEAIRLSKCDLLDRLPAGSPLLDPMRSEYRCGPGIPFDNLPPEVQANMRAQGRAPVTVNEDQSPNDYYAKPDPAYGPVTP